jgi:uncharacterized protein
MNAYLDASVLVKTYVAEAGSKEVGQLLSRADLLATSVLSRAEVPAALAKAARVGWLAREAADAARQAFRAQWPALMGVQVTEALMALADTLAWDYGLRGYDAVHLASALTWQEALGEPVLLATFDKQLWSAAPKAGVAIWPDTLA